MRSPGNDSHAPRLKIVLTREGIRALLKRLREQPVAQGDYAVLSKAAITGDRLRGSYCLKCGDHAGLYVFEWNYLSLCARCTIERIERLAGRGRELPPSVLWLHKEAELELKAQARREKEKLSVKFDDFYRCKRCAGLVLQKNARYWGPEGGNVSYPFHPECREIISSRREEFRPAEPTAFDFDV